MNREENQQNAVEVTNEMETTKQNEVTSDVVETTNEAETTNEENQKTEDTLMTNEQKNETAAKPEPLCDHECATTMEVEQKEPMDPLIHQVNEWKAAIRTLDDAEEIGRIVDCIAEGLTSGQLSEALLNMLRKSANYNRDIENAKRQGEIKGRNQKIDEYMIERRQVSELHDLGGARQQNRHTVPQRIIGGLSAADRTSIWDRGNEKRIKRG